jgi:hypothetical protein
MRHSIPTLFLSECVLIYMKDEHSSAVIRQIRLPLPLRTAYHLSNARAVVRDLCVCCVCVCVVQVGSYV